MSAQPLFDTGQLRRNEMKLAMSVGNSRHYCFHEIMPRHFVESAAQAGMPTTTVEAIFDELASDLPAAIDRACADLPDGFPDELRRSIAAGAVQRLERVMASGAA